MNKEEYWSLRDRLSTAEYKKIHKLLNDWKRQNNITERCTVHHRDDTEETRKYNSEHYERWGLNEDGTFEYGKYVIFMTSAEHSKYHGTGKNHSEETREKISAALKGENNPNYGKSPSEEAREKMSTAKKGENNPNYGKSPSDETREKMSAAHKGKIFSEKHRAKLSAAASAANKRASTLYTIYKSTGGKLHWCEFRKALKNGEIILADSN